MSEGILGARIREQRRQMGITQAHLARQIGISASYLNLIERNKRRIAGPLLARTAEALGLRPDELDGAAERRLAETLVEIAYLPALKDQKVEADAAGDLIGQYPGWARALAALARSEQMAQENVQALSDRLNHDPSLSEAVHRMLTRAASIRSASEILADYDDIPADQINRFHRIIHDEAEALAQAAEALVNYFDKAETADTILTPQDEVEALFEARANHFAELESPAAELHAMVDYRSGIPAWVTAHALAKEHLSRTMVRLVEAEPLIKTTAAHRRALAALTHYCAGAILMPQPTFSETAAAVDYDLDRLAKQHRVSVDIVCRRLAALPKHPDVPAFGYLCANAAGTVIEMQAIDGLAVPRFAGACPLWVLYRAQQTPEVILRQYVVLPTGQRFVFAARARRTSDPGFGTPQHFLTDMLVISAEDARHTVYMPGSDVPVEEVGPACRLCPRETCPHRVMDPLTS